MALLLVLTPVLGASQYHLYPDYPEDDGKRYHGPPAPLKPDGTVDDLPEVKAARAEHLEAYSNILQQRHSPSLVYHQYLVKRFRRSPGVLFKPAPLKNDGTVAETSDIEKAKAAHLAAYQKELSHADPNWVEPEYPENPAYSHSYVVPVQYSYHAPAARKYYDDGAYQRGEVPLYPKHYEPAPLNEDGTVADTKEIVRAKNEFYIRYEKELAHADPNWVEPKSEYEPEHQYRYKRSLFLPAPLKHDGTVDETPEVKYAKAVHLAAHQAAHNGGHGAHFKYSISHIYTPYKGHHELAPLNHDGNVDETPEVKQAKAIHLAHYYQAVNGHYL